MLKKYLIILILFCLFSNSTKKANWINCEVYSQGGVTTGKCIPPGLYDKGVYFIKNGERRNIEKLLNTDAVILKNIDVDSLRFTVDHFPYLFEKHLLFKNFKKEKTRNSLVWMRSLISGPMSLYLGFTKDNIGAVISTSWYCKKRDERAVSFITTKSTSQNVGLHMDEKDFRVNLSEYLKDNTKLVDKINDGMYEIDDIERVVNEYNTWYLKTKK